MPTYVVGDVHGRLETLKTLLTELKFGPADQLLFVGDLVNRGPQSIETIRFVQAMGSSAVTVLGNHDLYLLAYAEGVRSARSNDMFEQALAHPAAASALEWLSRRPLFLQDKRRRLVLVHAGIPPQWGFARAGLYARAAEIRLHSRRAATYRAFLSQAVREGELRPTDRPFGFLNCVSERSAVYAMNAFTNLRICDAHGCFPVGSKSEQQAQAKKNGLYLPWFERYSRVHPRMHHAICFGHWAKLGGLHRHPFYGLDTNCGGGEGLTAMQIVTKRRCSVRCVD